MGHVASEAVSGWARLPECRMAAQKQQRALYIPCGRFCGWCSSRRSSFFLKEQVYSYDDLREMDDLIFDLDGVRRLIRWSCSLAQDSKQR